MCKLIVSLLLILGFASSAMGAAHEAITVADTAIGFTQATLNITVTGISTKHATSAYCTVEDAQIRILWTGTNPTTGTGHPRNPGDSFTLIGAGNIDAFRAIRTGATSGTLRCTYE